MKRLIISVLCVSVFFVGLGAIVKKAGAAFKSDEKALELVRKARVAIGGDTAINGVQSLRIVGQSTRNVKVNGSERLDQGETEIALQFPDKFMKMSKIGKDDVNGLHKVFVNEDVDVVVSGEPTEHKRFKFENKEHGSETGKVNTIILKKDDGTVLELTGDEATKWVAKEQGNAAGVHTFTFKKDGDGDAAGVHKFTFKKDGDGNVERVGDKDSEKILIRKTDNGAATWTSKDGKDVGADGKHFIFERSMDSKGGELHAEMRDNEMLRLTIALLMTAPKGMDVSYKFGGEGNVDGNACNIVVAEYGGASFKIYLNKTSNLPAMLSYSGQKAPNVFLFRTEGPKGEHEAKGEHVLMRNTNSADAGRADFNVTFSDYRYVGGVQLPFKWTQTVGGKADETFDVTSYDINPANIAEKFQNHKVMVRTNKPDMK